MPAVSPQPPADLLPVRPEATPIFRFLRVTVVPLLHLLFRIRVEGRENVPTDRNYVLIANHLNWLDSFVILATFPTEPRVHFLGDTTHLVEHRVQWAFIKSVAGYIPVNRQARPDTVLFQHVNRCLQRGGVVALYPEGNYGPSEGELMPFKKGFAHFAIENHVPVLPVALSGTQDLWLRKTVRMIIGPPIETEGQSIDSLVDLAHEKLRALLPAYRDPGGVKILRRRLTKLF
ncbi:MAG TPA: 1-acyl-sn-glycerol-3-phosphate acyltransferase [Candidatus Dormibacteraeota bacterium]|nr:1-acyl-sn-glycerol-3-phosphate acyltransferase [Candidatus Dormibacteraeota bacterium]